jgi:hypothetical protein
MTTDIRRQAFIVAALASCTGCASIVSGRHAEVAIDSYPSNAHVVIHDKRGRQVTAFNTPGVASLKRQGRYFMPAKYTAVIAAPGYQSAQVPIGSTINPWILGNIVIGGIPGLVVDSATGATWKPKRSEIHQQLSPLHPSQYSNAAPPRPESEVAEPYTADQSAQEHEMQGNRR